MKDKVIIIGVAGASGSGKSLLATTIVEELQSCDVAAIPEDYYYKDLSHLSPEERAQTNFDHPDSLDHALLVSHLKKLKKSKAIDAPQYDFTQHTRTKEMLHIDAHRLIVLEGILLFSEPELRDLIDIRIFMDTPLDISLLRRIRRDVAERGRTVDSIVTQYEATVRPMYLQFVEPAKRYADIIVPHGGQNRIAIDMIKSRIVALLANLPGSLDPIDVKVI